MSDPEKKDMYDKFGTTNPNEGPNINPEDLFGQMFNMGGMNMPGMPGMPNMGGFFNQNRGRQQEDCILEHLVTLEDLYNNKTVTVKYNHKVYCKKCNGAGTKDGKTSTCSGCNGSGQKVRMLWRAPPRRYSFNFDLTKVATMTSKLELVSALVSFMYLWYASRPMLSWRSR